MSSAQLPPARRPDSGSPLGLPGSSPVVPGVGGVGGVGPLGGMSLPLPLSMSAAAHPAIVSQYYQLMADKLWGPGAAGMGMVSPPGSESGHQQHQEKQQQQQQQQVVNGQGKRGKKHWFNFSPFCTFSKFGIPKKNFDFGQKMLYFKAKGSTSVFFHGGNVRSTKPILFSHVTLLSA